MMETRFISPVPVPHTNRVRFTCPFCHIAVEAFTPTLQAGGKRCRTACYALFTWPDKLATRWVPSDDDWKVLLDDH